MSKRFSATQKITLCAMLLVLDILATHVIRTPIIGSFSFIRISLGPSLVIYSSLMLGPLYGAIVGGAGDILGILLFQGIEGQINPLLTIVYSLLGILPWLLEKLTRHSRSALRKPYAFYASLAFILILLASLFYFIPSTSEYFKSGFGDAYVWAMPLILGLSAFFDIALCVGLHFSAKYFQKRILELPDIPSPNEVALICLISEVILMVLLKPLAFYLFYSFMANDRWAISYGTLLSCMVVVSSANVFVNTVVVSWLLIWSRRFMNANGMR